MIDIIIDVLLAVGAAIATGVPCLISRQKKASTADSYKAYIDMYEKAVQLVLDAEGVYSAQNKVLKEHGLSAGSMKKAYVIMQLQTYALNADIEFNADMWDAKVEEIVRLTQMVNAKEG